MTTGKLNTVISDRNDQLEREALRRALGIIDDIVSEQRTIADSNARIADLRKQLVDLRAEQVSLTEVLGPAHGTD